MKKSLLSENYTYDHELKEDVEGKQFWYSCIYIHMCTQTYVYAYKHIQLCAYIHIYMQCKSSPDKQADQPAGGFIIPDEDSVLPLNEYCGTSK